LGDRIFFDGIRLPANIVSFNYIFLYKSLITILLQLLMNLHRKSADNRCDKKIKNSSFFN